MVKANVILEGRSRLGKTAINTSGREYRILRMVKFKGGFFLIEVESLLTKKSQMVKVDKDNDFVVKFQ